MQVHTSWLDYLTAFGTVGAVAVALGLAISDNIRRTRLERRAQAREVVIPAFKPIRGPSPGNKVISWAVAAEVENLSRGVIRDVTLTVRPEWTEPVELPTDPEVKQEFKEVSPRLGPNESLECRAHLAINVLAGKPPGTLPVYQLVATCEFTDGADTRWRIDRDHKLTRTRGRPKKT